MDTRRRGFLRSPCSFSLIRVPLFLVIHSAVSRVGISSSEAAKLDRPFSTTLSSPFCFCPRIGPASPLFPRRPCSCTFAIYHRLGGQRASDKNRTKSTHRSQSFPLFRGQSVSAQSCPSLNNVSIERTILTANKNRPSIAGDRWPLANKPCPIDHRQIRIGVCAEVAGISTTQRAQAAQPTLDV